LQDVERVRAILGTRDDFLFEPRAYLDVYILIPIEEGEDLTIIDRVIATNQILDPDEDFEIPAPSVEAVSTPPVFDDPIAGFTFDVDDLDVDFTDTSTAPDGTVVSWLWDFGDSGTSTLQNPSHTYASAGTYTVTLTVTDSNGNTDDFQDDVTVIENLVIAGLIVIWGQSNGLGFGVASGMSNYPGIATPYPAVQMWERGAPSPGGGAPVWTTEGPRDLQPRGTTIGTQVAGTNGIELTLMRALDTASPGGWYVLKVNANSTGLEDEWKTATYLNQLKSDINARLAAWSTTVVGMVSVIGETDSSESPDAANTYANLNTIYDDLRADFGDFAIAQVRLNSNYRVGADVPTVRAGQEAFVSKNPKARIVEIDDFLLREAQPLATHYADNEYGVAGERAAAKLLDVLLEVPTPAHPRYMGQSKPAIIGAGSALTYTMPEYYEGEDILVAWVMGLGNTAYAAPSGGWAQFPDSPLHDNADSLSARLQAFWMRVPGTVGTDQTGTVTAPVIADVAGDDQKFGAIMVLRGCASSGNPYDVTAGDTATTSTSISIPGDTTTVNNCLVIGMVAHKVDQLFAQVSGWAASGLTELTEQVDEDRNNTNGYGFAAVTGVITTAGSYGPITATLASTATQARMSIAFKP
jgi:PKD repeat protein